MDSLKIEFDGFISCMIEDTLSNLKTENMEYGKCRESEKNNVIKIREILNKLSSEDKKFMRNHEIDLFNIADIEQCHLYTKGYIYCVKLLKILGII